MGAKNMVIAGDYMGKPITGIGGVVQIYVDRKNYILLDKFGVDSYPPCHPVRHCRPGCWH